MLTQELHILTRLTTACLMSIPIRLTICLSKFFMHTLHKSVWVIITYMIKHAWNTVSLLTAVLCTPYPWPWTSILLDSSSLSYASCRLWCFMRLISPMFTSCMTVSSHWSTSCLILECPALVRRERAPDSGKWELDVKFHNRWPFIKARPCRGIPSVPHHLWLTFSFEQSVWVESFPKVKVNRIYIPKHTYVSTQNNTI